MADQRGSNKLGYYAHRAASGLDSWDSIGNGDDSDEDWPACFGCCSVLDIAVARVHQDLAKSIVGLVNQHRSCSNLRISLSFCFASNWWHLPLVWNVAIRMVLMESSRCFVRANNAANIFFACIISTASSLQAIMLSRLELSSASINSSSFISLYSASISCFIWIARLRIFSDEIESFWLCRGWMTNSWMEEHDANRTRLDAWGDDDTIVGETTAIAPCWCCCCCCCFCSNDRRGKLLVDEKSGANTRGNDDILYYLLWVPPKKSTCAVADWVKRIIHFSGMEKEKSQDFTRHAHKIVISRHL